MGIPKDGHGLFLRWGGGMLGLEDRWHTIGVNGAIEIGRWLIVGGLCAADFL